MTLAGRVLAGRYQLNRHLADGAMGAVWTARHLALDVPVAVKLMNVEGTMRTDLRVRFEQEAKALALLRNPHVIQVIDFGTDGDTPFIVMELLEGIDLLTMLDSPILWPLPEVAALVSQVAEGLTAAHDAGLIHRDVKPGNIFLSRSGKSKEIVVKLLDFGIAKWAESDVTITDANVVLGSPFYMSPEQIRAQKLDGRVDLWALAVVMFRLVTGGLPFTGRDGPEIASKILTGTRKRIAPPATKALELERFFSRAFAKDCDARFHTAAELAKEFILVAGVPSALKTAEQALASNEDVIPTVHRRRSIPVLPPEDSVTTMVRPHPLLTEHSTTEDTNAPAEISNAAAVLIVDELSSSELVDEPSAAELHPDEILEESTEAKRPLTREEPPESEPKNDELEDTQTDLPLAGTR